MIQSSAADVPASVVAGSGGPVQSPIQCVWTHSDPLCSLDDVDHPVTAQQGPLVEQIVSAPVDTRPPVEVAVAALGFVAGGAQPSAAVPAVLSTLVRSGSEGRTVQSRPAAAPAVANLHLPLLGFGRSVSLLVSLV
jgi:hypothetical protein